MDFLQADDGDKSARRYRVGRRVALLVLDDELVAARLKLVDNHVAGIRRRAGPGRFAGQAERVVGRAGGGVLRRQEQVCLRQ